MEQEEADFPVKPRFPDDEEDGEPVEEEGDDARKERAPSEVGGDDDDNEDEDSGEDIMKSSGNIIGSGDEDSSEEEEDDPEEAKRIAEGFIVDEDEESGSDEEQRRRRKRERRRRKRQQEEEEDEQLDEDDLALLAENTGVRRKQRQLKRFRRASASPDGGDEAHESATSKPRDLQHMFDDDDEDGEPVQARRSGRRGDDDSDDDEDLPSVGDALRANAGRRAGAQNVSFGFEDEMDDFIDDDEQSDIDETMSEGEREARRKEKREQRRADLQERRERSSRFGFDPQRAGIDAEAWAELNEVFGNSNLYDQFLDGSDEEAAEAEGEEDSVAIDGEERRRTKQRKGVTKIEDVFEPSAIQARMMTAEDTRIKRSDFPERFLQMLPGDEGEALLERILTEEELDECTRWVSRRFSYRSNKSFLSDTGDFSMYRDAWFKCVRTMVELIINQRREAMYLCVHRTDDYELRVGDRIVDLLQRRDFSALVAACLKFKTLLARRDSLRETFRDLSRDADASVSSENRHTFEELVKRTESTDEVADVADWLVMQFGQRMRDAQAQRDVTFKRPTVIGRYEQLKATTVAPFASRFSISSLQLAENIAGQAKAHFTEDEDVTPMTLADQYINTSGGPPSAHAAIDSARTMLSYEIGRDPTLKREVRKLFRERGSISVTPTDRGQYKIDDENPFYNFKFLNRKPISDFTVVLANEKLPAPAQYLMILQAEEDLMIEVAVGVRESDSKAFEDRLLENYLSEGMSETSRLWNEERRQVVRMALEQHLYPTARMWVREWLREECWEFIGRACEVALTKRIDCKPYESTSMRARKILEQRQIAQPYGREYDDHDDDDDEQHSAESRQALPKVLAVSNGKGDPRKDEIETVFVDAGGRLRDHVVFETLAKPIDTMDMSGLDQVPQHERDNRPDPAREFKQLLKQRRPDVIVVSGFSPRTILLRQQIQELVQEVKTEDESDDADLNEEQRAALTIDVIHSHDDVARLYQHSDRAKEDHPSLNTLARYCVGLARYVQSPVQQFAALNDEDLLAIRHDAYQHLIPRERLLAFLERALVAIVNTVCVDINRCSLDASYAYMLRYVSGLGPRKADALMRAIATQLGGSVVNRDALLMGASDSEMLGSGQEFVLPPNVWHNACSFLVIHPRREAKSTHGGGRVRMQGSPDALDGTRIHPEAYEYARFIAFDALRKTEEDRLPDQHPSQWCEELMRDEGRRAKVEDIDMADYERNLWAEMARQNQRRERKLSMLEFIARELVEPLHEQRRPFALPTLDDILTILTGETRATFDTNRIVNVQVTQVKRDFITVRFESGIEGTIHHEYLLPKDSAEYMSTSDRPLPHHLVKHGQTIKASIIDIDLTNLRAELTARPSHLEDAVGMDAEKRKVEVDMRYFDRERATEERVEREQNLQRKQNANRRTRFINHHLFRNFKAGQAEEFLANAARGTAIVRPSSKGDDHLAVTWKVDEGVFQHFDVQELDKDGQREVGRILRVTNVGGASYSDIDELIVNHVVPMARMVEMLMSHEKYHGSEEQLQEYLKQFSLANPNRSQYGFAIDKKRPGLFVLGFKANRAAEIQRWFVRVLPGRFKLNDAELPDVVSLCNAFKTQYTTKSMRAGASGGASGGVGGGRTPAARLGGGMTPGLMRTGYGMQPGGGMTPAMPVGRSGGFGYGGPGSAAPITATPNPYQYSGASAADPSHRRPPPPGAPPVRPGPPPARPPQLGSSNGGAGNSSGGAAGIHPDRLAQMGYGGQSRGGARDGYQGGW